MKATSMNELDIIDQVNARLEVLEAQAISYTPREGAESLRLLSPDVLSSIFWGFQMSIGECRQLINQLHQSKVNGPLGH